MKTSVILRNIHISARKAGLVCDLIRNKKVTTAITILENTDKKIAPIVKKLLDSAVANATNNHAMDADKLYIYHIVANQGRTIKRALPRAKGSSNMIRKRHCHIVITLSDDPQQKQKDLLAVKAKLAKRVQNSKAAKSAPSTAKVKKASPVKIKSKVAREEK